MRTKHKFPKANASAEQIAAFLNAGGRTITYCAPAFAAPSQQASAATRHDVLKQRQQARRSERQQRERARLSELYGASDPFALAASYQLGS